MIDPEAFGTECLLFCRKSFYYMDFEIFDSVFSDSLIERPSIINFCEISMISSSSINVICFPYVKRSRFSIR